MTLLTNHINESNELKKFLIKIAKNINIDLLNNDLNTLFDLIESDDNESLSWNEFEVFFMNNGWNNGPGSNNEINNSTNKMKINNNMINKSNQTQGSCVSVCVSVCLTYIYDSFFE